MRIHYFTLGLALFMLMGLTGHATAETHHLKCTHSLTGVDGVESHLDTNGDNVPANAAQGILICNGFRGLTHEELEVLPRPLTTCPKVPNMSEAYLSPTQGQHRIVITDMKTGDQLFGQNTSMVFCVDTSDAAHLTFSVTVEGRYVGGTGEYREAQGTFTGHYSGSFLIYGFKDGVFGGFDQATGETEATMILPKGN